MALCMKNERLSAELCRVAIAKIETSELSDPSSVGVGGADLHESKNGLAPVISR
jgi:hypothetical protein